MKFFKTIFLKEADKFIQTLDSKISKKIFYNIRIAEQTNDPQLFKKLTSEIWEFRIWFSGNNVRILAFWDKTDKNQTLVIATSGFFKKTQKTPAKEIERAMNIRQKYFEEKDQYN